MTKDKRTTIKAATTKTASSFAAIFGGLGGRRTKQASGLLKDATSVTSGEAYDRAPCPHTLVTHDLIADLSRPDDLKRLRTRRTVHACERPAGHEKSKDKAERQHATASGTTW